MKTVVVLGALGMAGHIMAEYLKSTGEYKVHGIARSEGHNVTMLLDVLDFAKLKAHLNEVKPDFVINCIGALVSYSRDHIGSAILINSYLPHLLSELGDKQNFKLVHISTDCVFSGKTGGYAEASFRDGDDNYARTKALGEITSGNHLTIRTSIIGPELKENGTGLMDWFFKQSGEVTGYAQAFWSGVTTLELAKAARVFMQENTTGLAHLCPKTKISKYELLGLINAIWNRGCTLERDEKYSVDKSLVSTRVDISYPAPDYKNMLEETKAWMESTPQHYPHYKFS